MVFRCHLVYKKTWQSLFWLILIFDPSQEQIFRQIPLKRAKERISPIFNPERWENLVLLWENSFLVMSSYTTILFATIKRGLELPKLRKSDRFGGNYPKMAKNAYFGHKNGCIDAFSIL